MEPAVAYKKLPGRGQSTEGGIMRIRHRIFAGPDHLLVVMHRGYSEDYKRFYFKDIQAVILRKTLRSMVHIIMSSVMLSVFLALIGMGMYWKWDMVAIVMLAIGGAFFVPFLLYELIRGPSCAVWIRSAVQEERLFALNRIRTARKAIRQINALLAESQGPLAESAQSSAPPPIPAP
jgi:hypothetical protein